MSRSSQHQKRQKQQQKCLTTSTGASAIPPALDKDIDEELLLDIPPLPPRPRQPISPMHQNHHHNHGLMMPQEQQHPRKNLLPLPPSSQQPQQQQWLSNKQSSTSSSSKNKKNKKVKTSRIESFHNAILTNMAETEQLRRQQQQQQQQLQRNRIHGSGAGGSYIGKIGHTGSGDHGIMKEGAETMGGRTNTMDASTSSLLSETIKDISNAAASTMETLKTAIDQARQQQQRQKHQQGNTKNSHQHHLSSSSTSSSVFIPPVSESCDKERTATTPATTTVARNNNTAVRHRPSTTATSTPAELTHLLSKWCGIKQPTNAITTDSENQSPSLSSSTGAGWEPHMKKMQEAVQNVVVQVNNHNPHSFQPSSSWQQTTQEIWRFAAGSGEDATPAPAHYNRSTQSSSNHHHRTSSSNNNNHLDSHHGYDDSEHQHHHHGLASPTHWANLLGIGFPHPDEDDQNTVGTLDTWQEENSQLRRLGSWGTIGSGFTSATGGTFGTSEIGMIGGGIGFGSSSTEEGGDAMRLLLEDDSGHVIDRVLLERTQKMKQQQHQKQQQQQQQQHQQEQQTHSKQQQNQSHHEINIAGNDKDNRKMKRKKRRTKVVQFDYPPIKSLRQYIRPDPEDLPNLFFTEQELDQIEEDRYCTMSTDDIEIVAVSSKLSSSEDEDQQDSNEKGKRKFGLKSPIGKGSPSSPGEKRDSPDANNSSSIGWKSAKGRNGTPHRRRPPSIDLSSEEDVVDATNVNNKKGSKSPSSKSPRLVKGVQIYLRERSTGA
jgi:hypothetical protein